LELIPAIEFDELNALLAEKNSNRGRKPYANGNDPLKGIPRKRTRFPGQHARCWYCGRIYVWGGNGIKDNLQCTGSRNWKCWNSIGLKGSLFCQHVVDSISQMLGQIQGLDETFRQILDAESKSPEPGYELERSNLTSDEQALKRERQNYLDAIGMYGPDPEIGGRLEELKAKLNKLAVRKAALNRKTVSMSDVPQSASELANLLEEEFLNLAVDSYEFGAMLPKIVPEVFVYCVRLCDGGPLLPRAKFTVDLSGSFEGEAPETLREMLIQEFTVDVFEVPKRERIRRQVIDMVSRGLKQKQIAEGFEEPVSRKLVNQSIQLTEYMAASGITDPLEVQLAPPTDLKKVRRHLNSRYSFSMEEGYQPSTI
jgi:site-specific DNA recombinase